MEHSKASMGPVRGGGGQDHLGPRDVLLRRFAIAADRLQAAPILRSDRNLSRALVLGA